jgi:hypothetical protein
LELAAETGILLRGNNGQQAPNLERRFAFSWVQFNRSQSLLAQNFQQSQFPMLADQTLACGMGFNRNSS